MDKVLVIVRGLPGSGKTTFAEMVADTLIDDMWAGDTHQFPVYSADDYFMVDGEYQFDANKLGAAHKQCKDNTEDAMKTGVYRIFVANTFTQEKEIKPYAKLAEKYNYKFTSVIVENRHGNNSIHGVPEEAMKRMEDRFSVKL